MTRIEAAALGFVAGSLLATLACLGAIAHETHTRRGGS